MIPKFFLPKVVRMILHSYNNSIRGLCATNNIKFKTNETKVIIFTKKNSANSNKYSLCDKYINRIDSVRNPGVLLDPKHFFTTVTTYFLCDPKCWDFDPLFSYQ